MSFFDRPQDTYTIDFDEGLKRKIKADKSNPLSLICKLVPEGSKVLDIGCGNGILGWLLKDQNVELVGVEPSEYAAELAHPHYDKIFNGTIEDYFDCHDDLSDFDIIVFADVLEHLIRPDEVLRRIKPKMSSSCKLLVSIPNIAHYSVLRCLLKDQFEYVDSGILEKTHLRFFTLDSFKNLLDHVDFIPESIFGLCQITKTSERFPRFWPGFIVAFSCLFSKNSSVYQYLFVINKNYSGRSHRFRKIWPRFHLRYFV